MRSQAVDVALKWAAEFVGTASPQYTHDQGPDESAAASEEIVELLGHRVLVSPWAMVCTRCGSYQVSRGKVAHCKLQVCCLGASEHGQAIYKQTHAISAIQAGRHPKTGNNIRPV